jgi:hypothetical protein
MAPSVKGQPSDDPTLVIVAGTTTPRHYVSTPTVETRRNLRQHNFTCTLNDAIDKSQQTLAITMNSVNSYHCSTIPDGAFWLAAASKVID